MNSKIEEKCKINQKLISLDFDFKENKKNNPSFKKEKSLKWGNTPKSSSNSLLMSQPLDVSNYKIIKKTDFCINPMQTSSESSTGVSTEGNLGNYNAQINIHENYNQVIQLPCEKSDLIMITSGLENFDLYDSLIITKSVTHHDKGNNTPNPNETLYYTINEDSFDKSTCNVQMTEDIAKNTIPFNQNLSELEGIKTVDEMRFVLQESIMENREGEYIWDNSIKIVSFLSQGGQAKVYLGLVMETDSYVAIKRYMINYKEEDLNRIIAECDLIKTIEHDNIIKYFDMEYMIIEEENGSDPENNKLMSRIDLIMEYVEGMNLKDYLNKHAGKNGNNSGLAMSQVKHIARNILGGLKHLHENKIIHRDLKPENVLVTEDLKEIKIADFGISTKVKNSETFKNRSVLGTAYYMAPEVISEKPYAYEADIWSLGCIVYELVSGVKPYNNMNPVNAMYCMVQYASPIEYAEEHIKDIFYEKANRSLLDFLQKCWRPNNSFRPSAHELADHTFLKD